MPAVPNVGGDQCQLVCFGDAKLDRRVEVETVKLDDTPEAELESENNVV